MDKSKTMMMVIIALLVLLLGTVVAVTIFLLGMIGENNADDFHEITPHPIVYETRVTDTVEVMLGDGRIATNLAIGPEGTSDIVSAEVVVLVSSVDEDARDEFLPILADRIHIARAIAGEVLRSLTYNEVRTVEGQQMAGELILHRLQEEFETNLFVRVVFSDWSQQRGR